MKGKKKSIKEEEMEETTKDINATKKNVRNLVTLLKKKLIVIVMIMKNMLCMFQ